MNVFVFIIFLGIINIVFGFLWKWVFVLPSALLFTLIKLDRAMLVVKAFGAYLLISLTALATLRALQDVNGGWKLIIFPLIGGFVLFMGFSSNAYEQRKQAHMSYDYSLISRIERDAWFDLFLMLGSIVLYILILFIPAIAINPMNNWLFNTIKWAFELPIIGWIIGIGGVIFMLGIIWYGIIMLFMLGGSIYAKIRGEVKNNVGDTKIIQDVIDDNDFEEVPRNPKKSGQPLNYYR